MSQCVTIAPIRFVLFTFELQLCELLFVQCIECDMRMVECVWVLQVCLQKHRSSPNVKVKTKYIFVMSGTSMNWSEFPNKCESHQIQAVVEGSHYNRRWFIFRFLPDFRKNFHSFRSIRVATNFFWQTIKMKIRNTNIIHHLAFNGFIFIFSALLWHLHIMICSWTHFLFVFSVTRHSFWQRQPSIFICAKHIYSKWNLFGRTVDASGHEQYVILCKRCDEKR